MSEAQPGYCANHPGVATALRCNRCDKYICTRCAVLTPVGYRCKECVRSQQNVFFTAGPGEYLVSAIVSVVAGVLLGMGGSLLQLIPLFGIWLGIIGGPVAGRMAGDLIFRAAQRRRGRYLWLVAAGGLALGVLPFLAWALLTRDLWGIASVGLFGVLGVGAAVAWLRFGK
jgi:hypothetical protein